MYAFLRLILMENEKDILLEKIFFLNTTQTGLDIYYTTKLPKKFFPVHPFGSVVGPRTLFGDESSLTIYNNCNLGRNNEDEHPFVEGDLIMLPNSSIIGNCKIEGKVLLSNGCYLYNPGKISNKMVFGTHPNNVYKDINLDIFNSWNEFID
jgi:serine acetyltransferase